MMACDSKSAWMVPVTPMVPDAMDAAPRRPMQLRARRLFVRSIENCWKHRFCEPMDASRIWAMLSMEFITGLADAAMFGPVELDAFLLSALLPTNPNPVVTMELSATARVHVFTAMPE